MKKFKYLVLLVFCLSMTNAEAQFLKKLKKRVSKAAEEAVIQKAEEKAFEKSGNATDTIIENPGKVLKKKKGKRKKGKNAEGTENSTEGAQIPADELYEINRPTDFTAGNVPFFKDDFMLDNLGDFPAKWDTNGSGDIVEINGKHWFRLSGNSKYIPILEERLPENYTIEFDMLFDGLDNKTSSEAWFKLLLEDTDGYQKPKDWCMVELSPCQFIDSRGVVEKVVNGQRQLRNEIGKDYRETINGKSHVSIAVNKTRIRVWLNENKLVDIPRLVPEGATVFKLYTKGLRDAEGLDELYITNITMAKSGEDNRSKLLTEGRLSTNAILFESGNDALKDESYVIIREIAQVLQNNPEVHIKIIGHTDADGEAVSNLALSKARARAVKKALRLQYGISEERIVTDGMGESEPVASNSTTEGKAQNRRVEFIKL